MIEMWQIKILKNWFILSAGTFRLHSPAVLLGYERTGNTANVVLGAGGGFGNTASSGPNSGVSGSGTDQPNISKNATYLNIYLTIQVLLLFDKWNIA